MRPRLDCWRHAFALACALSCAPAFASDAAQKALQEVDAIRSSRPEQFAKALKQLDLRSDLDPGQREHLAYLHAYEAAYSGRFEESILRAKPLAEHGKDIDIRVRAGSLMINSYTVLRKFADGLRQLDRVLAISGKAVTPEARAHATYVASMLHNQIGQYRIGQRYADEVLDREDTPPRTRCFASELKYEAMINLRTLPVDNRDIEAAIAHCSRIDERIVANFLRGILARKMVHAGQRGAAIRLLQGAMPEIEATRFPNLIGQMHSLLGEILLWEGRTAEAEEEAKLALVHSGKIARSLSVIAAYRVLHEIAERRGDAAAALRYYKQYAEADVDYLNEVNAREMAYQMVRQETRQKGQQIALLNRQNQVLQLQRQVDRQATINMQVLAGLLLLLTSAIGYWAYRVKRMEHVLRAQAETDSLTGVCSRQHFHKQATRLLDACAGRRSSAAIVMFDLDHFKDFNDRYGHDIGDWVLRRTAEACRGTCRPGDLIGRLGGEEFAMLLVDVRHDGAVRVAEACRQAIQEIDSAPTGISLKPSASFGISMTSDSDYDLVALLSHADKALYRAKHDGRNCVRTYDDVVHPAGDGKAGPGRPSLRLAHSATPQDP